MYVSVAFMNEGTVASASSRLEFATVRQKRGCRTRRKHGYAGANADHASCQAWSRVAKNAVDRVAEKAEGVLTFDTLRKPHLGDSNGF